jgi:hypothetical protein
MAASVAVLRLTSERASPDPLGFVPTPSSPLERTMPGVMESTDYLRTGGVGDIHHRREGTMEKSAPATMKCLVVMVFVTLAVTSPTAKAQDLSVLQSGTIEGTWDMQVQWRNCDDGTPLLGPVPDLRSFARGGVMTELDSTIWCDSEEGHCPSLGVWKHLGGRRYVSAHKRFRLDPSPSFDIDGHVIATSNMTHEADDTLTTSETLRFYDRAGALVGTRCRTAVGTRFTGER